MRAVGFVWDEAKERLNSVKHGIRFDEAQSAFLDEAARLIADPDHSQVEERFLLLGMSQALRVLLVCHCYRQDDQLIRIISARKATRAESNDYHSLSRS
jgi:hypothetical protein